MTPDDLRELLADEQARDLRSGEMDLSLADQLEDDDEALSGGPL